MVRTDLNCRHLVFLIIIICYLAVMFRMLRDLVEKLPDVFDTNELPKTRLSRKEDLRKAFSAMVVNRSGFDAIWECSDRIITSFLSNMYYKYDAQFPPEGVER